MSQDQKLASFRATQPRDAKLMMIPACIVFWCWESLSESLWGEIQIDGMSAFGYNRL
jgi:hypothetical protein